MKWSRVWSMAWEWTKRHRWLNWWVMQQLSYSPCMCSRSESRSHGVIVLNACVRILLIFYFFCSPIYTFNMCRESLHFTPESISKRISKLVAIRRSCIKTNIEWLGFRIHNVQLIQFIYRPIVFYHTLQACLSPNSRSSLMHAAPNWHRRIDTKLGYKC